MWYVGRKKFYGSFFGVEGIVLIFLLVLEMIVSVVFYCFLEVFLGFLKFEEKVCC